MSGSYWVIGVLNSFWSIQDMSGGYWVIGVLTSFWSIQDNLVAIESLMC